MGQVPEIVVVGLGYVGLPLAVALARRYPTRGLDIDAERIAQLIEGDDRTGEIGVDTMLASSLSLVASPAEAKGADIYIVTVPTPIDDDNIPDLSAVRGASRMVGQLLRPGAGAIVVYESTVYPGVTEDICVPILEDASGLQCGQDFFVGYSPERINPGDREHTVDRITKVVAGQTPEVLDRLAEIYGSITTGGIHRAASIKVAEAAKVIENAQRDINIAFINEITRIFAKLDLSIWDVLEAAGTKWNFLPFTPGLVGGHCIGVDPYYLAHRASELGHDPRVILAGRGVNDGMADWVAESFAARLAPNSSVLVLGATFKPDVPDLRNSKAFDLSAALEHLGHHVTLHDPFLNDGALGHGGSKRIDRDALSCDRRYDAVLLAVAHAAYRNLGIDRIRALAPGGVIGDLPGVWLRAHPGAVDWHL